MQLPRKSVLAGVPLGLIPVVLGVVGIVTPEWINLSPPRLNGTYGLFSCNNILCRSKPEFRVVQGLEIAGVAAIAVACPLGFLTAIYFSFVAGFGRYLRSPRTDGVEQLTERF